MTDFLQSVASIGHRTDAEVAEWTWKNEITPRLKQSGISVRHWQRITDWKNKSQATAFKKAMDACTGVGAIVALVGNRGSGKTTIAAQLILRRAENDALPPWERIPPYRKLVDIIARYKPLYADHGSTMTDDLMTSRDALCRNYGLLVIDEIHECDDQKLKGRVLTDIIDRRYSARKDTVLISNQTPQDFQSTTSDSVLSRLSEHGVIIPCNWASWRTKQP